MSALFVVFLSAASAVALLVASVVARRGERAADLLTLERSAVLASQLVVAGTVLLGAALLVAIPAVGPEFLLVCAPWAVYWFPSSRRDMSTSAQRLFTSHDALVAALEDVSRQPQWIPNVVDCAVEPVGPLRLGSVVRQTIVLGKQRLTGDADLTEYESGRRMVFQLRARYARPLDVMALSRQPDGTVFRYSGRASTLFVIALITGLQIPATRRSFVARRETALVRLAALLGEPELS